MISFFNPGWADEMYVRTVGRMYDANISSARPEPYLSSYWSNLMLYWSISYKFRQSRLINTWVIALDLIWIL